MSSTEHSAAAAPSAAAPASVIPDDPMRLLRRGEAAAALRASGFPISAATLATRATRGDGPPFCKFGPWAVYRWGTTLAWAEGKLAEPRTVTAPRDGSTPAAE